MEHRCPICKKPVKTRVPKGGDGSEVWPRWHKSLNGTPCAGRFHEAEVA